MTNTMKRLAVLLIGTLFVLCVAIVLAVSLPVSTAFAAEGETATDTGSEATVHDHNDGTWTAITADGGTLQSGNYYLTSDVTLTTDITIADNATVTLCLNGYKLTGTGAEYSSVITVGEGASFTLDDCQSASDAAECQHKYYVAESGLWTFYDGDLPEAAPDGAETGVVTGGVVTGGNGSDGGGVYVFKSTLNINGGTFAGNTVSYYGGAIYGFYESTLNINGGTISGNQAMQSGGAIHVSESTLNINGGTISGNTSENGGAICVISGTLNIEDGTFESNTAKFGGAIYGVYESTLNINGGTISGNTSENGGAIYGESKITLNINGGTISGNTSENGGAIRGDFESILNINGGTISGNQAMQNGGAICVISGTLNIKGGEISGNKAMYSGGAVFVNGSSSKGSFTMEGGTISNNISNNTATSYGGSVYVAYGGTFTMTGGYLDGEIKNYGTISISGGYLELAPDAAYCAEGCEAYDISALGTALDENYKEGFAFAIYKNGTAQITASANDNIVYDGSPVAAGTDFTVTGADDLVLFYAYKTGEGAYAEGLPAGAGTYTVKAAVRGADGTYNEAEFSLTIVKATYDMSGITFADGNFTYDGEAHGIAISGTLPAGVSVTYDVSDKVNAGEYTVTATFAGDYANYNAIPDMTAKLTIEKGVPSYTAPTELAVVVDGALADITLPEGWAWKDGTVQFTEAGEYKAVAVYTPADTANYNPVEVELTVTVSESEPTEPDQPTEPDEPTDPDQPTDPEQPGGEITSEEPEGLSGGAIAGIVIGCILGVLLIEYAVCALLYRKKLISGAFFAKIYPFIKD